VTAMITPQDMALGVSTYAPVTGCRDVIPLCPTTFLHFYNDGAIDDDMIVAGSFCTHLSIFHVLLSHNSELIIGPFDMDMFYPEVSISHSHPGDVTMAALFIAYESEGCDVTVSTVCPSIETTSTGVSIDFTASTESWLDNTAVTLESACPQPPDVTVVWPTVVETTSTEVWADLGHTDFTVIWCGL